MPATNPIQTSRGYRRRIFPAFVLAASLVAAAETESRPSGTAVPPSNFDSGLNRLREKKSGPAGEPGKNEAADAVKAAKAAEPAVVVAPSTATAKPVTIPEGNQSRAVASTAGVAPPAGPVPVLAPECTHGDGNWAWRGFCSRSASGPFGPRKVTAWMRKR